MKRDLPTLAHLSEDFGVQILQHENWQAHEWDQLHQHLALFADLFGGREKFRQQLGDVIIERTETGASLGLAYNGRIQLSAKTAFSAWSVIHELAHVWDAKNGWKASEALERFTQGSTNPALSSSLRFVPGGWDAAMRGAESKPGRYGRKPGCNAAGYFYGGQPSGSNWSFNRREDFAESVVMYCGWERGNELSRTAHGRIQRYLLPNGTRDPLYGIIDNWSDYARFFYPEHGDYATTQRWNFVHEFIQGQIQIPS